MLRKTREAQNNLKAQLDEAAKRRWAPALMAVMLRGAARRRAKLGARRTPPPAVVAEETAS